MEIKASEQAGIALLEPVGSIDTRAALDFEHKVVERLDGGARLFAVDFRGVDLITSAGIRVLVMLAKKLHMIDGRLVLCNLSQQVTMVFDIAGLTQQFRIASSTEEAMAQLSETPQTGAAAPQSRISRLVARVMGGASAGSNRARQSRPDAPGGGSGLSARVAELLTDTPSRLPKNEPPEGKR